MKSAKSYKQKTQDVFLVSEATGGLARHLSVVATSQFPKFAPEFHRFAFCNTMEKLRKVKSTIESAENPLVMAALTQPGLRRSLQNWCERREIPYIELIGDVVRAIATAIGQRPVRDAMRTHRCDNDYYRRMDAWEFTLQHDDSRRLESIDEADIILLGISRVGKTPLSAYLGSLGYRVANVSIANGLPIPTEVKENRERTVGLTIHPDRLTEIRKRRFELNRFKHELESRGERPSYYSARKILNEVDYAEQQFRRLRISTLDMTDLTVEESAVKILQKLGLE